MLPEIGLALGVIFAVRVAVAARGLALSMRTLSPSPLPPPAPESWPKILLVVPALRETRIIAATLDHLSALDYPPDRLILAVAAARETPPPGEKTTAQVARDWAAQRGMEHLLITEYAGPRVERALQINHAVAVALAGPAADAAILGVYDADSRPHRDTLRWVAWNHAAGARCQQQVLHYLDAAADLARQGAPALCVANAVYQGSWSLTKEWPNLLRYRDHCRRHGRASGRGYAHSLYMNGHGQFLDRSLFDDLGGLPLGVVTDGIQLGYRLSLLGEPIAPIPVFCSDDVPATVRGLRDQHKRWFSGNIRFAQARAWAAGRGVTASPLAILDNLLLNGSWALRLPLAVAAVVCLLAGAAAGSALALPTAGLLLGSLGVYGYVLPVLAAGVPGRRPRLRWRDWAMMPVAAAFKSVGPLIYLSQTLRFGRDAADRTLRKVER